MAESTTQHPLRVAYLCPRYLITRGGAELLTRRLAEEMADRGHEVTVFAADPGGERKGFLPEESPRLRVRELPRSMCMERLFGALRGLEHRKGGYRLFRMLTRDGRRLVLGKGPYCRDVAKRSLYAGFDAVTLMA
ncbi:MAG: glycosyltransferase, partial [Phycisphaerae bacterium]|nr:glycosyltransferase [Phycisphaerae bacterium]